MDTEVVQQARGTDGGAAHEDAQVLQVGQVVLQAAICALAAEVGGPQTEVFLADAEVDAVHGLGVRGGDDTEDIAVARVGEEELVGRVQDGRRLGVDLAAGLQQAHGDVVLGGGLVGPPEGIRRAEGEGVDAVAQFAGEREQQGEGGVGHGRGRGRRGEGVGCGWIARAGGGEGVRGRVEHGGVGRVAAGRRGARARGHVLRSADWWWGGGRGEPGATASSSE